MKLYVKIVAALVFVCQTTFAQSTLTNFKKGSLIIPMDNAKQNLNPAQAAFNVKAYGLLNALLQNNIPVNWIIKNGKLKDEADFSVQSSRLYPTPVAPAFADFKAGPLVIDSLWAANAIAVIVAYGNNVAVYRAELAFTAPVRYQLLSKPKIAVFTNGNSHRIHTKALRLAGFSSPRDFDSIPAQTLNSSSCYTFGCEPHWTNGQNSVTSAVTNFLNSGGNLFTQCAAIAAYENIEHYHTTNGINYETAPNSQVNTNIYFGPDNPLMQFEGVLTNAPTGTVVNYENNSGSYQPATQFLVKKNQNPGYGVNEGDVVMSTRKVGPASVGGYVTYLGGHDYLRASSDPPGQEYARANDVTWNNGLRIFYNAIFIPSTRPISCEFVFAGEAGVVTTVNNAAPCKNDTIMYKVQFTNSGPGTAHDIVVKTPANQAGLTYLSNTPTQGTYSNGTLNWTIGDLSPNQTVELTIKYKVVADGTYNLKSYNANLIAGNNFANDTSSLQVITNQSPPTITAPANLSRTTNSGCTATGVNLGTPVTADNCGIASVTNNAPSAFPLGSTTVTWTVTDNSGNTAIATQTVTVTDNVNPTITPPANVFRTTNSGCTATGVNLGTPTTADNCGVASVTNNAPSAFPLGSTTVTWTVTDNSGNTATATQTVIVTDNVNPTITPPANVFRTTNSGCTATGVNLGTPTTADNCGVASVTNNAPSAFPLGTTTVTWTVTDNSGNTATATQTVTVSDNVNPTITAPANLSRTTNSGCTATGVNLGTPTTADNCGVATVTNNAPAAFPLGMTTVTWTVTDNSGNTATATQTVTVSDNVNPTITAPANVSATTNSGCTATGVNLGTPTTADNCGVATVTNNAPSAFPLGTTTVTWTVTDNSGNTATATQAVTVTDNINPTITAPANVSATTNSGCTATGVNLGTPTTADNCGVASVTNNAPSAFPIGSTTVTWTVTDNSGNTATATQTVTVTDNVNPTITAPANIAATTNSGCTATGVNLGTPTTADNCGVASVTNNAPSAFPIGSTTVTWTVTDNSGNTATATQTVTVSDNVNPTITAPANIAATTNTGCTATGVNLGTPTTADNCGVASVTNNAPSAFPLGTTTVTWTVTDNSGNTATATQTVTVTDNVNPTITAPANVSVTTNSGCTATGVNLGTPVTADNCGVASVTNNAPSVFPIGPTTVTWTVTDNSGNTATATQTVTVSDNVNPTITTPANIAATTNSGCTVTGVNLGTPTTADNCGVASVTNNAPSAFPLGITTVIWTVTDNSGNTATATQTVTVSDNVNPTITAPANVSATTNSGCTATGVNLGTPTTADNCGVASVTNNAPSAFSLGTTIVTWTVTDNSGNTATATQTVTVTDNVNPTITAPANVSATTNSGCTATGVNLGAPTTADNCGVASVTNNAPSVFPIGSTTVTWTVTDNSGNTATATQTVTVADDVNPTITAPANVSATTNLGCTATGVNLGTPTTADNCGVASVTNNAPSVFPIGSTTVTWTVTDNSGNTATATQSVTVTDTEPPAFVNCFDTIKSCESTVFFDIPSAIDNCTVTSFNQTDGTGLTSGSTFENEFTTLIYMAIDAAGNENSCAMTIHKITLPGKGEAGEDDTIYKGETTLSAVADLQAIGSWTVVEGIAYVMEQHNPKSFVTGMEKGSTTFLWTLSNEGCEGESDTVKIMYVDVNIPNGFSPDGDNVNDYFEITGIEELGPATLIVNNRWGDAVYTSSNYLNGWDGKNEKGQDLSDDTYYYRLKLADSTEFSGFIILKRK